MMGPPDFSGKRFLTQSKAASMLALASFAAARRLEPTRTNRYVTAGFSCSVSSPTG